MLLSEIPICDALNLHVDVERGSRPKSPVHGSLIGGFNLKMDVIVEHHSDVRKSKMIETNQRPRDSHIM